MATIKITDFELKYNDKFIFDTNIWLLLNDTVGDFQKTDQKKYSKLFETLISSKSASIYVTSLIMSEFSNVILRRKFKDWQTDNNFLNKDFKKDFVNTDEYQSSVEFITRLINKIFKLPNVSLVGDNFTVINKEDLLEKFKLVDFNDAYIAQLAILNDCKIVTNDKDFQKLNLKIDVITSQV